MYVKPGLLCFTTAGNNFRYTVTKANSSKPFTTVERRPAVALRNVTWK
jgi:hypothetical protein